MKTAIDRPLLMSLGPCLLAAVLACADASARVRHVTDPDAPRSLAEAGPVSVRWEDPATFSEIRYSQNRFESSRGNWVEALAAHLRQYAAARLPAGERLDVNLTDVERAGDFESWRDVRFRDTRFMRDIYPPRIRLSFTRTGADGAIIAQGERRLTDPGFLTGAGARMDHDPLRYEKALLERWLARELPRPH